MKKTLLCTALATLVAFPLLASAAPRTEGQWYLSPKVGYGWSDEDRVTGNGPFLGLGIGYVFRQNWTLEGEIGYHQFDRDNGDGEPLEWRQLSVNAAVRYLVDYGQGHPYFGIAFGAGNNELRNSDIDDWGYQIGPIVGFEWDLTDSGALRFEVAQKYTDFDAGGFSTGFWDTSVMLGYTMYFGGSGYVAPMAQAAEPPMAAVEPPMAPAEEPVPPLPVSITLNGVNFDFDKCTLRSDAIAILDEAVRVLNGNDIRVEVAGHTDWIGSDAYNQKLSECRANVVGEYLTGNGVSGAKISSVNGYGESRPIDTNDTAEGRARNRRTELNVQ
jgi:OOP family OmpA-OmpF porin